MTARSLLALALLLLAASACAEREPDPAALKAAAIFRYNARAVYDGLLQESCEPDPALRRSRLLAAEGEKVRRFERKAGSGPLRFQLEVARSDIELVLAGGYHCWDDSDPRFAAAHVGRARDWVKGGLAALEELAPSLASLPRSPPEVSAAKGARFRTLTRELVEPLNPLCRIDRGVENKDVLAPARAEAARFRQKLQGSPYAIHFDMAEADVAYERSITVTECIEPRVNVAREAGRYLLEKNRITISRLREIAGV